MSVRDILNDLEEFIKLNWVEMEDQFECVLLEDLYDFLETKRMDILHTHFDMEVIE